MVRLAQSHARIMCHETVELMDAIAALTIIECSMQVCTRVSERVRLESSVNCFCVCVC
eukprot:m.90875 g.90875  ORF g.90875 m.90875 type:complete len:58 (+) comp12319_c0_seq5:357-530(+)